MFLAKKDIKLLEKVIDTLDQLSQDNANLKELATEVDQMRNKAVLVNIKRESKQTSNH